jgi:uncharacterized integral membrane protein (TIGR00698 family)
LALAALVSAAATFSAEWIAESLLGLSGTPVSPIMLAIVLGMVVANVSGWAQTGAPGFRFCSTTILRLGIVLLGFRLSLLAAGKFTLAALPFVVIAVAAGVSVVRLLGPRLGLSRTLAGLIAAGTSICGATAIVATAPLIRARQAEVTYAVSCITVFGIAAMFGYPILAHAIFGARPELAGLFLGASIHETAQVAGAGAMYQVQYGAPLALDVATVTKLVRNLSMLALIPLAGILFGEARTVETPGARAWLRMIPWFVVGFAACSALRTLGDHGDRAFGLLDPDLWSQTVSFFRHGAETCLLMAMAGVGLQTTFAGLRSIGVRPFLFGLFAALVVGAVSLALIAGFGGPALTLVGY